MLCINCNGYGVAIDDLHLGGGWLRKQKMVFMGSTCITAC
jgi:hypothetical protein